MTRRETEDFITIDHARQALLDRGFVSASVSSDCYRLPDRDKDDGFYQMADVFVPHNDIIGRVSYWQST